MDDLRVLWMRDRVYQAFGLTDPQLFEDLLNRDDGEAEDLILHFLNQTSDEEGASTLFFYRALVPEEVDVESGEPRGGEGGPAGGGLGPQPPALSPQPPRRVLGARYSSPCCARVDAPPRAHRCAHRRPAVQVSELWRREASVTPPPRAHRQ